MLKELKRDLAGRLARRIHERFGLEHEPIVQIPPRRDLGDLASPAPLHLAKILRRKPREIASEIAEGLELPPVVRDVRVEGAGYLNAFFDRSRFAAALLEAPVFPPIRGGEKIIVEHTNINPNKAAHIGHLRNAVLGDVLVQALRRLGHEVEVQNYIDDTGVQLADVVVGFADLRGLSLDAVAALPEPFDHVCWDLYSEVGRWYAEDRERETFRRQTLHALEAGEGPRAALAHHIARRVLRCHLQTMGRLGITYDLLTHESDILALDFFTLAFEALKQTGAVRLEQAGKNRGCWVMPLSESQEFAGLEDPDKVIVRSDGTVTYVGKDIAYQLWKLGLLGRDFGYRLGEGVGIWETTASGGTEDHPRFGDADRVINVIDARQSYLQRIVRAGLEAMGHREEAERSIHFAYEMVSLSRATATELGFLDGVDDAGSSLEMSGRRGIGVKADDLLDRLEAKSLQNVDGRHEGMSPEDLQEVARQIATGALRFFMVKATTTRVIAFDFDEALSFEGETGPYLQYSMVRERNIRRKLAGAGIPQEVSAAQVGDLEDTLWEDDLWDLVHATAQLPETVAKAAETLELSFIARQALELAQKFHAVYHRHPILHEADERLRTVRLAATQLFRRGLHDLLELLGIPVPERM